MGRILGLTPFRFALRVVGAILTSIAIFVLAFYIPDLIFSALNLPLISRPVYLTSAILLTALGVLGQIFRGHLIGTATSVALAISVLIYLIVITNSGLMRISAMGLEITLEFPILLYLFVVSGSIGVISTILSAIARSAGGPIRGFDEAIGN